MRHEFGVCHALFVKPYNSPHRSPSFLIRLGVTSHTPPLLLISRRSIIGRGHFLISAMTGMTWTDLLGYAGTTSNLRPFRMLDVVATGIMHPLLIFPLRFDGGRDLLYSASTAPVSIVESVDCLPRQEQSRCGSLDYLRCSMC